MAVSVDRGIPLTMLAGTGAISSAEWGIEKRDGLVKSQVAGETWCRSRSKNPGAWGRDDDDAPS